MLKRLMLILPALMFLAFQLQAQSSFADKIKDPDFLFQPAYLDKDLQQPLLPLEKLIIYEFEGSRKVQKFIMLKGLHSRFRINSGDSISFIVKQGQVETSNIQQMYALYKLTEDKKKESRKALYHTYKESMLGNSTSVIEDGIPIVFRRIREDVYLLSVQNPGKGEYAILFADTVFSFGVD